MRYGKLTIIEHIYSHIKDKRKVYLCKCDCGELAIRCSKTLNSSIRRKLISSCNLCIKKTKAGNSYRFIKYLAKKNKMDKQSKLHYFKPIKPKPTPEHEIREFLKKKVKGII